MTYGTLKIGACEIDRTMISRISIPARRSAQKRSAGPPRPVGTTANPPSSPTPIWVERQRVSNTGSREKTTWNSAA